MLAQRFYKGQFSDFELRLLRVFLTVVECGGFSLAEVELGTTKSAISKQMSDLESRLGVRLCERGRSGFSLTEEGTFVYESAITLFAAIEEFRAQVNSFHENVSGKLFMGFIDTMVTKEDTVLHRALKYYSTRYPNVELNIMTGSAVEIDQSVLDRRIHVGVTTYKQGLNALLWIPLFEEKNLLYCGKGHPLFDTKSEPDITSLKQYRFARHGYSEAERKSMTKIDAELFANAHMTEDVLFLVMTGNYLGFLPVHYAEYFEKQGKIKPVMPGTIMKVTNIQMIINKLSIKNPIVEHFLDVVREIDNGDG